MLRPHPSRLSPHSPTSSYSATSDLDLDSVIDVSATMLSSQTRSLLVLAQSASSNSNLLRSSPSPSNTTTPSLTSVITVLDHKTSKSPSPSVERCSPSASGGKFSCAPEPVNKGSPCFYELDVNFSSVPPTQILTPPVSAPSPRPVAVSMSPLSKTSSPSPASPLIVSSPTVFTSSNRQLLEASPTTHTATVHQAPVVEPSLDEALDKLLAMSFSQNHTTANADGPQLKNNAESLGRGMQEVTEELILPMDRSSVQPDTFTNTTNTFTDESVDGGTDGNGDLDWADEELSMSLHDGLDGTMTPYTERLYTDGSMTPLTEASWMDESMTPSSCPGTPDVTLDLPLLQTPTIDRVSASGHVRFAAPA